MSNTIQFHRTTSPLIFPNETGKSHITIYQYTHTKNQFQRNQICKWSCQRIEQEASRKIISIFMANGQIQCKWSCQRTEQEAVLRLFQYFRSTDKHTCM